jgi:hypothetical protein
MPARQAQRRRTRPPVRRRCSGRVGRRPSGNVPRLLLPCGAAVARGRVQWARKTYQLERRCQRLRRCRSDFRIRMLSSSSTAPKISSSTGGQHELAHGGRWLVQSAIGEVARPAKSRVLAGVLRGREIRQTRVQGRPSGTDHSRAPSYPREPRLLASGGGGCVAIRTRGCQGRLKTRPVVPVKK